MVVCCTDGVVSGAFDLLPQHLRNRCVATWPVRLKSSAHTCAHAPAGLLMLEELLVSDACSTLYVPVVVSDGRGVVTPSILCFGAGTVCKGDLRVPQLSPSSRWTLALGQVSGPRSIS